MHCTTGLSPYISYDASRSAHGRALHSSRGSGVLGRLYRERPHTRPLSSLTCIHAIEIDVTFIDLAALPDVLGTCETAIGATMPPPPGSP